MLVHDGSDFLPVGSESFNKKIRIDGIAQVLNRVFARLRKNVLITLVEPKKKRLELNIGDIDDR